MRVAFVTPELRWLDAIKSDAMCLCLHKEDWPLRGTPGLVDWRVGGHLSRLREAGWITCEAGELVLMPLGRRLPCERLLVVGMGSVDDGLDEGHLIEGLHRLFGALEKMRVHATMMHLPGRPIRLPPEQAIEILLDVATEHPNHDEVVVVESVDAQRVMEQVIESRRSAYIE